MKRFIKNNQSFICINCGKFVPEHPKSSRDHCNQCLYGLHVDINPGDRLNTCKGILNPIGIKLSNGQTKIVYECSNCLQKVFCIASLDDSQEIILKLSNKVWK